MFKKTAVAQNTVAEAVAETRKKLEAAYEEFVKAFVARPEIDPADILENGIPDFVHPMSRPLLLLRIGREREASGKTKKCKHGPECICTGTVPTTIERAVAPMRMVEVRVKNDSKSWESKRLPENAAKSLVAMGIAEYK